MTAARPGTGGGDTITETASPLERIEERFQQIFGSNWAVMDSGLVNGTPWVVAGKPENWPKPKPVSYGCFVLLPDKHPWYGSSGLARTGLLDAELEYAQRLIVWPWIGWLRGGRNEITPKDAREVKRMGIALARLVTAVLMDARILLDHQVEPVRFLLDPRPPTARFTQLDH